ncbi:4'-phosphopantetheinyl transferase family protein [Paraburkholderia phosphatilytica]|uniref:4'-phosphopantetheinyl transferase family protein n=1 Tax=Paraburkholderia phosphatilytica TaxID=2282883 RepID=UPI000E54314C|nr:hypothetical protein [Paraburkholderia phosphatilytica]
MIADPTLDEPPADANDASPPRPSANPAPASRDNPAQAGTQEAGLAAPHAFELVQHRFGYPEASRREMLRPDELLLWRFRAEWMELSRDAGYACMSKAELARVRTHPNRALSKRFAVGRAMLREILSRITGIAPAALDIVDDVRGQPQLVHPSSTEAPVTVALVNAGVWILAGVAASPFGLDSTVMPQIRSRRVSAGGRVTTSPREQQRMLERVRDQVRQSCIEQADASRIIESGRGLPHGSAPVCPAPLTANGAWQTVDLPMPDAICAGAAFSPHVARVNAFGWVSRDGRAIAGRATDLSV